MTFVWRHPSYYAELKKKAKEIVVKELKDIALNTDENKVSHESEEEKDIPNTENNDIIDENQESLFIGYYK